MIADIEAKIRSRCYEFSRHALDQSIQHQINVAEFEEAFAVNIEIIEDYPDDKYGPSCLVLGYTRSGRALHLVAAIQVVQYWRSSPFISQTRRSGSMIGQGESNVREAIMTETMIDTTVTYTIVFDGKLYVVEHVPARVCEETGEEFFSPNTVERIQALIKGGRPPARMIETSVFEYAQA